MYCKCKNNDRFPRLFIVGKIYICYWYNGDKTHVKVRRTWPAMSKLLTIEDFLHTFDYLY